jgi:S1-C subfamily serine protease
VSLNLPARASTLDDDSFGAVTLQDVANAGPVRAIGRYPDVQVLVGNQTILQDHSSDSIYIVAAFPNWQNPATVVLHLSPGGNACAGSYAVLDVITPRITDQFGNCAQVSLRQGSDSLVFAFFSGDQTDIGWAYKNGQLIKIPTQRAEQHVQTGVAAYQSKNYSKALENLWLVRQSRFAEVPYYLGLMANFGHGVPRDYVLAMSLYKKAAELGSPEALFRIGALFAAGRGVAKNQNEAMQYYVRAAELGSNLAQYNAAMGYLSGVGVAKDVKRALFWLLIARDGLSDSKLVDAVHTDINIAENELDAEAKQTVLTEASSWRPTSPHPIAKPSDMKIWVGKYPHDRVRGLPFFEHPEIQILINGALGFDAIAQLEQMGTVDLIKEQSDWLIAHGCQPHDCIEHQWLVAINLSSLETRVCLAGIDSPTVRFGASGRKFIEAPPHTGNKPCPDVNEALSKFDLLFPTSVPSARSDSRQETLKIYQGMQYAAARAVILSSGWQPSIFKKTVLNEIDRDLQDWFIAAGFAEIEDCSPTGDALCVAVFHEAEGKRKLYVFATSGSRDEIKYLGHAPQIVSLCIDRKSGNCEEPGALLPSPEDQLPKGSAKRGNPLEDGPRSSTQAQPTIFLGTGFFVSADGKVLTNAHVVRDCRIIRVRGPERVESAQLIARDEANDLAQISIDKTPSQFAKWRGTVRQGEDIAVYGFPLAGLLASGGNITIGNITALAGIGDDTRLFQISAPLQPGNSGGPVLDRGGSVVGVVVSKLDALRAASALNDIPQNVNFAIKGNVALSFLDAHGTASVQVERVAPLSTPDLVDRAKVFTVGIE